MKQKRFKEPMQHAESWKESQLILNMAAREQEKALKRIKRIMSQPPFTKETTWIK